jgi:hypothetical protein
MPTNQVINDIEPRTQISAFAGQVEFNTTWTADVAESVLVYARASTVAADDATQLVSSSEYSVSFVGSTELVRVTFNSGRTTGDIITIVRATDSSRTNLYINTNFTASMLNQDFGTETLVQQQNQMNRSFSPHYNFSCTYTNTSNPNIDLILPILDPNHTWAMSADGTEIIAYDITATGGLVNIVDGTANQIDVDSSDPTEPVVSISPTLILPGTMQAGGDVDMDGNLISNVLDPVSAQDAATKAYVDAVAGGGLIGWTNVTGTTQSIFPGNGYVTNNGSLVVLTLPATAAFGTVISIVGLGAGGWRIDQNAGQNIQVGSLSSTTGTSGSVASTNQFDSINLVCTVANTRWATHGGVQGALTIV